MGSFQVSVPPVATVPPISVQKGPEKAVEQIAQETEESSSDESDDLPRPVLIKPRFVPKNARETVLEKERQAEEAELAEQLKHQQIEERTRESRNIAAKTIEREVLGDEGDDAFSRLISQMRRSISAWMIPMALNPRRSMRRGNFVN
jgi:hypothetical protein